MTTHPNQIESESVTMAKTKASASKHSPALNELKRFSQIAVKQPVLDSAALVHAQSLLHLGDLRVVVNGVLQLRLELLQLLLLLAVRVENLELEVLDLFLDLLVAP